MDALFRTMTAKPDAVLVLGPPNTPQAQEASAETGYRPGDAGDLGGYGVPVRLCFDGPLSTTATTSKDIARLPLAHTLAAWLLDAAGFSGQRLDVAVGERVLAAGVPSWRDAGTALDGIAMTVRLHYVGAPFGVLYVVASWISAR